MSNEYTMMSVTKADGNDIEVRSEDSTVWGFEWQEDWGPVPEIGTRFQVGGRFGTPVTFLKREDGTTLLDEAHFERQRQQWLEDYERERKETYAKNKESYRQRVDALDPPFRDRMERFIEQDGFEEFFIDTGDYELFTVEQSNLLYRHWKVIGNGDTDWFLDFKKASYETQKRLFPDMDEGHSGNTHDWMVGLAHRVSLGRAI